MRLILSVAMAFVMPSLWAASAQGTLLKVWIESTAPEAVWGQYSGQRRVVLFDTGVGFTDRFTSAGGWKISRFASASLSPDVRRVAFKAVGTNSNALGIYRLESRQAQILDTSCDAQAMAWSPNGRYLAVEDAQGLLNNTVRVVGYDNDASEMEISGDVLSDLGYSAYRFQSKSNGRGQDIWRTQVFSPRWTSESALTFKVKRVHLKGSSADETATEDWRFDVVSKKFVRL
ncbi:MAG: hypothetical protein HY077_09470 [Elusimicrobia bacterium]|nr:hypothetical protein [Elusimicrobiota bacterium]